MIRENLKKIVPRKLLEAYRKFRRWERFRKRYSYNQGKPYFKTVSVHGVDFEILIDPYKNCCVDDFIAQDGVWEPKISESIKKFLPEHGVFVDVGANIGYHSLFAASVHNRSTTVFSFEPQNEIYNMIQSSASKNAFKNLKVYNVGISNTSGKAELNIFEENKGASSLVSGLKHHAGKANTQTVDLRTLDSLDSEIPRIDVIKIDVEGYELEVILGAMGLIKKYNPVMLIEFSPGLYRVRDEAITGQFISLLDSLRYKTYTLDEKEINLKELSQSEILETSQIDIICLPDHESFTGH